MNIFLPLVGALQNSGAVINVAGPLKGSVGPVVRDSTTPTGNSFVRAFSQVFREQEESGALSNQTSNGQLPSPQPNRVLQAVPPQQLIGSPGILDGMVASEGALGESPVYVIQPIPEGPVPVTSVVESLSEPGTLLSPTKRTSLSPGQDEPLAVNRDQGAPRSQPSIAKIQTKVRIPSLEGSHPTLSVVFQESGVLTAGGDSSLGKVRQDPTKEQNLIDPIQRPLLQVPEPGVSLQVPFTQAPAAGGVAQQTSQGQVELPPSVVLPKEEERSARVMGTSEKTVLGGLDPVVRSTNQDGTLPIPRMQRSSLDLTTPLQAWAIHRAPLVPAVQAEGPVGFTEQTSITPSSIKPIPGISAVVNEVPGSVSEHRPGASVGLLAESEWLRKGERPHTMVENIVRNAGVDPSGGPGLGAGMQQFSHSQSGFQQPSLVPGQGMGVRALEERVPEFPTPVLQRLQMDVQLSENTRVQIDVGVHQRQVYAGLVMDQSVLKNLAAQFVPQLEQQLADVDMELKEFSAEVREERDQQSESLFHDSRSHGQQDRAGRPQGDRHSTPTPLNRHEERGVYFVA